jgi:putative MATE family efflux protein
MIVEKLLQSTGKTMLSTIAQISGALINIILDPILIFGFANIPALGIKGAAYATVIGQIVTLLLGLMFNLKCNKEINFNIKYLKPIKNIIKEIYQVGIPAILMQSMMSFMTYGVNIIFANISSAAVTAYGIYYKIQQFVFFAAFGMNNAIIPIISFNYGKQDEERVNHGIKFGLLYTLIIMMAGFILLQSFANNIIGIFALSSEIQDLCIKAIRIITLGYLFVGANIAFQGIFQSLGNGVDSLIVSSIRLIVVALPLAWLFTTLPNSDSLIWLAFPIAEVVAFFVAIKMMKNIKRDKIVGLSKNLNEQIM